MCLLVFAWKVHPRYRLIFAGNRDEFHDRPAAPLQWWDQDAAEPARGGGLSKPDTVGAGQRVLAGRDLLAGGTWLGLSRGGRFGVVTNYRDLQRPLPGAPSRGELVTHWLTGAVSARAFGQELGARASGYAGFNLLIADDETMLYGSNRASPLARVLPAGIYGLSNHLLDTPWPKLARTRERFAQSIAQSQPDLNELERMLADRQPASDGQLPATGLPLERERLLSAPFIVDPQYGTRCTTVVMMAANGRTTVRERRFDQMGRSTGMEEISFEPQPHPGDAASA